MRSMRKFAQYTLDYATDDLGSDSDPITTFNPFGPNIQQVFVLSFSRGMQQLLSP
jgi:hypothetical protein